MNIEKDVEESTQQTLSNVMIMLTCWYFNLKYLLKGSFLKTGWLLDELLGINGALKALISSGDWWVRGFLVPWGAGRNWQVWPHWRNYVFGSVPWEYIIPGSPPYPSLSPSSLSLSPTLSLSPFWTSWVEQPPLPHSPYSLMFCRQRTLDQHL